MSASEAPQSLERLNQELRDRGVLCELCTAGGALFSLVFAADPPDRQVKSLFLPTGLLHEATVAVRDDLDLPEDWLVDAVRSLPGSDPLSGSEELTNLRVFAAPPEYLLAMKCAALNANREPSDRDDIRYLLRFLGLSGSSRVLEIVNRYFSDRQLPPDLAVFLDEL